MIRYSLELPWNKSRDDSEAKLSNSAYETEPRITLTTMKSTQSFHSMTLAVTLAVAGWTVSANAADDQSAINPTGTWKVSFDKQTNSPTLKLKLAGDKLTGTMSRQAGYKVEQTPIQDGKLKGDEISFATHVFALSYVNNVLQPPDTNKMMHSKFQGKISGDTIKGTVERESTTTGTVRTLDWEAKRVRN
jgi:hypothetical protein